MRRVERGQRVPRVAVDRSPFRGKLSVFLERLLRAGVLLDRTGKPEHGAAHVVLGHGHAQRDVPPALRPRGACVLDGGAGGGVGGAGDQLFEHLRRRIRVHAAAGPDPLQRLHPQLPRLLGGKRLVEEEQGVPVRPAQLGEQFAHGARTDVVAVAAGTFDPRLPVLVLDDGESGVLLLRRRHCVHQLGHQRIELLPIGREGLQRCRALGRRELRSVHGALQVVLRRTVADGHADERTDRAALRRQALALDIRLLLRPRHRRQRLEEPVDRLGHRLRQHAPCLLLGIAHLLVAGVGAGAVHHVVELALGREHRHLRIVEHGSCELSLPVVEADGVEDGIEVLAREHRVAVHAAADDELRVRRRMQQSAGENEGGNDGADRVRGVHGCPSGARIIPSIQRVRLEVFPHLHVPAEHRGNGHRVVRLLRHQLDVPRALREHLPLGLHGG